MAERPKYTPINEVKGNHAEFHLPFPVATPDTRIGVNVGKLERACRLAGVRSLTITGSESDERGGQAAVVGVSPQGEAILGRLKTADAAIAKPHLRRDILGIKHPRAAIWNDASIDVNVTELTDRVSRSSGVSSPEGWADELDKILKSNLAEFGWHANVYAQFVPGLRVPKSDPADFMLSYAGGFGVKDYVGTLLPPIASLPVVAGIPLEVVLGGFAFHAIGNTIGYLRWKTDYEPVLKAHGKHEDDYYRLSIFNGMHFDRQLALAAVLKTGRLVAPTKQK